MVTTISDAISMTTLTHNGSLSISDFEHRRIHLYTYIKIRSNKLTPEIDYQERHPCNVCYSFRPVIVDGESMNGNWCDQCHLNKRSGCSNLTYHESGSGQVPMSHPWLLARSTDVPVLVFLVKVLRSRRSGKPMFKVCSLDELRIGRKIVPNHVPPVIPVFMRGEIVNHGTFGPTASGSRSTRVDIIAPSETSSRTALESTQVSSDQVPSGSLMRRRSGRLTGNVVLAAYTEREEEQDELENDEYPFGSEESDCQWEIPLVSHSTISAMETPNPQLFLESVMGIPIPSPLRIGFTPLTLVFVYFLGKRKSIWGDKIRGETCSALILSLHNCFHLILCITTATSEADPGKTELYKIFDDYFERTNVNQWKLMDIMNIILKRYVVDD
ncbi:hypothetical protein BDC45DRAFT_583565 [Circinella umbellata]|nr:hypothetical protein BDC45DRAFT_583565 [Circinella umbellata]